jgi:hypothetical protein
MVSYFHDAVETPDHRHRYQAGYGDPMTIVGVVATVGAITAGGIILSKSSEPGAKAVAWAALAVFLATNIILIAKR